MGQIKKERMNQSWDNSHQTKWDQPKVNKIEILTKILQKNPVQWYIHQLHF